MKKISYLRIHLISLLLLFNMKIRIRVYRYIYANSAEILLNGIISNIARMLYILIILFI